jgi:hypothetical protein
MNLDYETELRDAIFGLHTRRFGTVAEIMIKKIINGNMSGKLEYDLFDKISNTRIECKFSRVQKAHDVKITENNVLKALQFEADRHIKFAQREDYKWDSNIQQVKKSEFDQLFYGVFFSDLIVIFRINADEIGKNVNYSDKQHRGNTGEGQFHLNNQNIQYHLNNHLYKYISYFELQEWLQ